MAVKRSTFSLENLFSISGINLSKRWAATFTETDRVWWWIITICMTHSREHNAWPRFLLNALLLFGSFDSSPGGAWESSSQLSCLWRTPVMHQPQQQCTYPPPETETICTCCRSSVCDVAEFSESELWSISSCFPLFSPVTFGKLREQGWDLFFTWGPHANVWVTPYRWDFSPYLRSYKMNKMNWMAISYEGDQLHSPVQRGKMRGREWEYLKLMLINYWAC